MKQEKLCETEDMTDKDYNRWYMDPTAEAQFKEELGAENVRRIPTPPPLTAEAIGNI